MLFLELAHFLLVSFYTKMMARPIKYGAANAMQPAQNCGLPPKYGSRQPLEPVVGVLDVSLSSAPDEPHWPAGGFNVTALVRK